MTYDGTKAMAAARKREATATDKGRAAALAGEPRSACPYPDTRTARGSITFSRAYRRWWLNGYDAAKGGRQ